MPNDEGLDIPILDWFEDPIKQSINSVFKGLNASVESLDLLKKYHAAHTESLRQEVQHIKLLGMSIPAKLTDIYNPARVSTTIQRRLYTEEWIEASSAPQKSKASKDKDLIDGDNYIENNNRTVVLGGPGAGKTTLLKYLALCYIDKQAFEKSNLKHTKLPFFVYLPDFSKAQESLFEFLLKPIKSKTDEYSKNFLDRLFKKGQCILLLDSLDETKKSARAETLQKVKDFCNQFPHVKMVISCRTADYADNLESFHEVEISKLNKAAVHKIVKAWFSDEPNKSRDLCNVIDHDKAISSLTETPLLLSLLCIQFKHDLSLPKRKVELFKRCSEALLRDWDTTRGFRRDSTYEILTDQSKERLFETIAYHFTAENFTFTFPKPKVVSLVSEFCSKLGLDENDALPILTEIDQHHGILEQFSQDHYGFSHTSFQEYFSARSIAAKGIGLKIVQQKFDSEDWYPIIEFIVAMAEDPSEMIQFLVQRSNLSGLSNYPPMAKRTTWLYLLYRCMISGPFLSREIREEAINHIISSQIEIARIYGEGGVFPMSQLMEDGIRHPFYWTHRRPSLSSALKPFRQLTNEILKTVLPGYPEAVLAIIPELDNKLKTNNQMLKDALLLNLVTPLARTHPNEVRKILESYSDSRNSNIVTKIIEPTISFINSSYSPQAKI
ncbi:NACHT domain-containing protein [Pseudomonas citronellolis]|uniref:NACHT domain-containing protein n=1 Tax=Pseudomonas citronellolis TaxID=53408 RepID=UPI000E2F9AFC|nr:NACHT domain-containing protein [Pseudomonas citronellolis]GBL58037.1 NACHT domain-containing protein [Pseudomonas citronellolis]